MTQIKCNPGLNEPVISTRTILFADSRTDSRGDDANMVSASSTISGALMWSGGKLYVSDTAGIMKLVTSA